MITSTANARVRKLIQLKRKSKARKKERCFVAEGLRFYQEIPKELLLECYVSETFQKEHQELLKDSSYEVVSDEVFAYVSDTQTPQGILCVVRMADAKNEGFEYATGTWIVLENLQDPGNLGTIFRTAEGAGVSGIILDKQTADVYAPKVIRSTMGSVFRVPFMVTDDLQEAIAQLKDSGNCIYAASLEGSICYDSLDYKSGAAFLIGNEGNGLTKEIEMLADQAISIPMQGKLESLNAAVATAILVYEAERQKRQ